MYEIFSWGLCFLWIGFGAAYWLIEHERDEGGETGRAITVLGLIALAAGVVVELIG